MNNDIRLKTALIIKRGDQFLIGRIFGSMQLRWSNSPWDAWSTRKIPDAKRVARQIGGTPWLFNPVSGELREARV